jgi:hypothetical protein
MASETKSPNIFQVAKMVLNSLFEFPATIVPFAGIAVVNILILALLALAPFLPLLKAAAAFIGRVWGEVFLHYPANFVLLPELFSTVGKLAGLTVGVFLTGVAISAINQAKLSSSPRWGFSLKKAYRRYYRLAVVGGIMLLLASSAVNVSDLLRLVFGSDLWAGYAGYVASVLVLAPFSFAMPAIVIENRKIFNSIDRSLSIFFANPVTTMLFVCISGAIFLPAYYMNGKIPAIVNSAAPDLVFYILGSKIILANAAFLVAITSATVLLVALRKSEARS